MSRIQLFVSFLDALLVASQNTMPAIAPIL